MSDMLVRMAVDKVDPLVILVPSERQVSPQERVSYAVEPVRCEVDGYQVREVPDVFTYSNPQFVR